MSSGAGMTGAGKSLSLRQALGTKFSYEELMAPASLLSQVAA